MRQSYKSMFVVKIFSKGAVAVVNLFKYFLYKALIRSCSVMYSTIVVQLSRHKFNLFYNEQIYVVEKGKNVPLKLHTQSKVPDNNRMPEFDC